MRDWVSHSLPAKPAGFALLEVLITVLVISVGLLGLAGLQLNSLQGNQRAHSYTTAVLLANDIAERMRSNVSAARAGRYEATEKPAEAPASCEQFCDSVDLARFDLSQWYDRLQAELPEVEASVDCVDLPCVQGSRYDIRIGWDDNRDGDLDYENLDDPDPVIVVSLIP